MKHIDEYIIREQLGSGAFAVVWRATRKLDGKEVVIKEIPLESLTSRTREGLQVEISLLKGIRHPNIVRLFDVLEDFLVLEYCSGGDLATYIREKGRVNQATTRKFMQHLGAGLQYLHASNLMHRDLKPENLLLSCSSKDAILKISDFGLARKLEPGGYADTVCGSPLYMAPEVLQFQKYDGKADLWSVGAILFQLVTGDTPFRGNNHVQILRAMKKYTNLQFPESLMAELDPYCIDLCEKLLCVDPAKRLFFDDFINHKFLNPI